jgi:hypothetical protein
MKPSSAMNVRPYVEGMVPGIGEPVGTIRWYEKRIDNAAREARRHIENGDGKNAAREASMAFMWARLSGHWSAQEPGEVN